MLEIQFIVITNHGSHGKESGWIIHFGSSPFLLIFNTIHSSVSTLPLCTPPPLCLWPPQYPVKKSWKENCMSCVYVVSLDHWLFAWWIKVVRRTHTSHDGNSSKLLVEQISGTNDVKIISLHFREKLMTIQNFEGGGGGWVPTGYTTGEEDRS